MELSDDGRPAPAPRKRPGLVTLLAVLFILFGVVGFVLGLVILSDVNGASANGENVSAAASIPGIIDIVLSVGQAILGFLMLPPGLRWVHFLAIAACILGIFGDFIAALAGSPGLLVGALVNIGILTILARPEVKEWFDYS
jgi:hypothetical protein